MAQTTEQEIEAIKDQLDKLQEALEIANENGLLKKDSTTYEEILGDIIKALQDLPNNPLEARKKFSLAHFKLNEKTNSTRFWWRFIYSYGGPVLLYLLTIMMTIFLAWIYLPSILLDSKILWVPSWAYIWGSIGGILQGFWWLWQHVSNRSLRKHWFIWFTVLPFMGAVFGALAYLVYFAGFVVATGETRITSESFVILLSALAGFNSKWAVQILDKLATVIKVG